MCAARRTASTRLTRLAAKKSPYHSSVTLYQAQDVGESEWEADADVGPSTPKYKSEDTTDMTMNHPSRRVAAAQRLSSRWTKASPVKTAHTEDGPPVAATASPEKRTRRPLKSKTGVTPQLDAPHPTPKRWQEAYDAIKAMRAGMVAPVDTMGCQLAQRGETEPKNKRFATLVSLMLSPQTKDEVTDAAVIMLRAALGGAISVQAVMDADETLVAEAIAKVGFWRKKTTAIKAAARRLHDDFDADVPKTVEALCSLSGVGPKIAFLTLQVAWDINAGIGVDVHVHRITNRLGWHNPKTESPEATRVNLESWLPKPLHGEINHLLVGFGQTICLPQRPKCSACTLGVDGLCPSAEDASARSRAPTSGTRKPRSASSKGNGAGPKIEIKMEASVVEEEV